MRPTEIIFEVTEAPEGGYDARSLRCSIFTQGEDWNDLEGNGERCCALPLRRRQSAARDQAAREGGGHRGMKRPQMGMAYNQVGDPSATDLWIDLRSLPTLTQVSR